MWRGQARIKQDAKASRSRRKDSGSGVGIDEKEERCLTGRGIYGSYGNAGYICVGLIAR